MTQIHRMATVDDAQALLELLLAAYAPHREAGINFVAATADLPMVIQHIESNMCYLLEQDQTLIATVSLRMPWGPNPGPCQYPHIGWLAVHPDHKQKGIGGQLLRWLEETIVRDTFKSPKVTLATADKHPWLAKMYERQGYQKIDERDLGRGHMTIYFQKTLIDQRGENK